jgi:hypothetical protein
MIADIVNLSVPSSAEAYENVLVDVSVKNLDTNYRYIAVTGTFDSSGITFTFDYLLLEPGQTVIFRGVFTMPSKSVRVSVNSYYWDGSQWIYEDSAYKDVSLELNLAGKIVDKWVNKAPEGNRLPIPANVNVDGHTFEVGVSYRNDSSVTITGGVEVVVTKPSGQVVTPAIDWAGMGPGASLNKEYNIAAVDQTGQWQAVIRFLALT